MDIYIRQPLLTYTDVGVKRWNADALLGLLSDTLDHAAGSRDDADALVGRCFSECGACSETTTGFPDLPGDTRRKVESKRAFEEVVSRISA